MQIFRPFKNLPNIAYQEEENNNYAPFVFIKQLFSAQEVDKIKLLWNQEKAREGKIENKVADSEVRRSNILFIDPADDEWIYNKLEMACTLINLNRYKFDLRGFQTKLQLTQYKDGGFYGWHMDCGNGKNSIRKLSITVQLSTPEEYTGGNLQFLRGNDTVDAPREAGTAVLFPSYAAHRVEPVTSGNRMSIVGWIGGPPYR